MTGIETGLLALLFGYLMGSIPSAYLVARFWGHTDLLREGDGHISSTAVFRNFGVVAFTAVLFADTAKGFAAAYVTGVLTGSSALMAAAGLAAVVGHCWSVFLRFRGGLGAVVIFAVLGTLSPISFIIAGVAAGILTLVIRRSSISTYALLVVAALISLIRMQDFIIIVSPLIMLSIQITKSWQTGRGAAAVGAYRNNLFYDLKRVKSEPKR